MPSHRTPAALKSAPLGLLVLAGYFILQRCSGETPFNPPIVKQEMTRVRRGWVSTTRLTDFVAETRSALAGESSFIGARVVRDFTHIEHVTVSILCLPSDATVLVSYRAEFAFGYDLTPAAFTVTGDQGDILVTLPRPRLVASPGVHLLGHEIADRGLFIDEEAVVIELQQAIHGTVQRRAATVAAEPAVVARCEETLALFLRALLARHGPPPTIRFTYR